jgi:hypothetical protein
MAGPVDPRDADRAQVASSLSGGAGDVVRARGISGGVHFHAASPGRAARGPRHLLPDTALFTGRDREMDELLALAGQAGSGAWPGAAVISAIDGMGGIGKTALALHAAHRLADHFPDGQLFINLAGFTAVRQPLDPEQALAELLRDLGIPLSCSATAWRPRAGFYRDRLHGTRTLMVLDNAASEEQIRPLLPGTGTCLVLITSRKRLAALDDALPLPLDVLAPGRGGHAAAPRRPAARQHRRRWRGRGPTARTGGRAVRPPAAGAADRRGAAARPPAGPGPCSTWPPGRRAGNWHHSTTAPGT